MTDRIPVEDDDTGNEIRTQVGGWAMVPNWVFTVGLTPGEFTIYVAMRSYADRNGTCWPTAKTIADRAMGASLGSVHNAFSKFRKLGLITTTTRTRPDGSTAGLHIVMVDLPPVQPPAPGKEPAPQDAVSQGSPGSEGQEENTPIEHPTGTPTTSLRSRSADTGAVVLAHPASPPSRRAAGEVKAEAREVTMAWMQWAKDQGRPTVQKFAAVMKLCEVAIANGAGRDHVALALTRMTTRDEVVTTQSLTRALSAVRGSVQPRLFIRQEDEDWYQASLNRAQTREDARRGTAHEAN